MKLTVQSSQNMLLKECFEKRESSLLAHPILIAAIFSDPRVRHISTQDRGKMFLAKNRLKKLARSLHSLNVKVCTM